ncbi:hypothetical protein CLAFUW4_07980 [Fulvia fulva]|nr:hypothetical protein CLAFUR4_07985 [Fulvia fulva]WPV12103.1 hypothetical protein CLAFUW4_07980 [Fulvia fulva]WPV26967.1 hypothetical protein CLAFUW7_07981 [Fulvia fulva]
MAARRQGLTRHAPALLRKVAGKEHASDENHEPELEALCQKPKVQRIDKVEKVYPSPATTASGSSSQAQAMENGSDAEPESDDDLPTFKVLADFKKPTVTSIEAVKDGELTKFRMPGALGKEQEKKGNASDDEFDNEPDWLASSQPKSKKRKVMPATNIHATAGGSRPGVKSVKVFGSAGQKREQRLKSDEAKKKLKEKEKSRFKTATGVSSPGEISPAVAFKLPQRNASELFTSSSADSPVRFATAGAERSDLDELESLSDLDEKAISTIEEGKQFLPPPKPYVSTHKCEHCEQDVEKLLYEEFLDTHHKSGKELDFKWQRRFCTHHKKSKAEALWKERGYPQTIDWRGLPRRMGKHDDFLRQILRDEQESVHRKALQRQLAPGRRSKNIGQMVMDKNVKAGTLVGYYGPRGQKAMVDHIIDNLSDDIREQAINDDIVMASGAQGGVSGFVQCVLVPHLAEMLIKEDLFLTHEWEAEVRDVIAESGELGELMNPETEDEIKEVDDDADDDEL